MSKVQDRGLRDQLKALAFVRRYVPAILAYDTLSIETANVVDAIEEVVNRDPSNVDVRRRLDALLEALKKSGVRLSDGGEHPADISDQYFSYAMAWGDAGYLLGMAVGMQLGPQAFGPMAGPSSKGGAR